MSGRCVCVMQVKSAIMVTGLDLDHHVQSTNGLCLLDRGFPRVYLPTGNFMVTFCIHVERALRLVTRPRCTITRPILSSVTSLHLSCDHATTCSPSEYFYVHGSEMQTSAVT
jgi:hypothetical protein